MAIYGLAYFPKIYGYSVLCRFSPTCKRSGLRGHFLSGQREPQIASPGTCEDFAPVVAQPCSHCAGSASIWRQPWAPGSSFVLARMLSIMACRRWISSSGIDGQGAAAHFGLNVSSARAHCIR